MILCPSLSRPWNIARLAEVAYDAPITVMCNRVDPLLGEYEKLTLPDKWRLWLPKLPLGACATFREAYRREPGAHYFGFIGDDCVPETDRWWEKLAELAGDWRLAWPDDGIRGEGLPTHPFLGGKLVRAVGNWAPKWLFHSFWDNYWAVIALKLHVAVYAKSVKIQHLHPMVNKAEWDSVYLVAGEAFRKDEMKFVEFQRSGALQTLVDKLREVVPDVAQSSKPVLCVQEKPLPATDDLCTAL